MKRILSGIRANNELTLGNYLGALKPWVQLQPVHDDQAQEAEFFFFIPNLHSLTARPDPQQLRHHTLSNVAWYLAAGLDAGRATLYLQSQIPAHSELAWIFNNYVTMGELSRMTQYKDKVRQSGDTGQLVGLFTYPTLMAADILLYDADEVPVGEDQTQHVELARDVAERFNNLYGPTFVVPKAVPPVAGARIMNLQDPSNKMSKSDQDASGNIMLSDSPAEIEQKIMRAVTDSGDKIAASPDKPALSNLLEIFSATTGRSIGDIEADYQGKGYGDFKRGLARAVIEHLQPIQQQHDKLMGDQTKLLAILEDGRAKAAAIAEAKLGQVKQLLGLL